MKIKNLIYVLLLIFLFSDLGYSFYQHYHMSLGGDMAEVIIPTSTKGYYKVLQDPFGLDILFDKKTCANPNRFFAHLTVSKYFLNAPIFLQKFTNPINSVYLASAIAKTVIQLLIIYLITCYITGCRNIFKFDFLLVAVLITPLFQTCGYNRYIGIIDKSVVYTFFYALPLAGVLAFFLPFFKILYNDNYTLYFSDSIVFSYFF